jgi:triosephosphate isomerase
MSAISLGGRVFRRAASYAPGGRKFFVGGNWKANGSHDDIAKWTSSLNGGRIASSTEVVVAPPAVHLASVRSALRKDIAVSSQVIIE